MNRLINFFHRGNSPMDHEALIQAIAHPGIAAKLSSTAMTIGGGSAVYYGFFTVHEWAGVVGAAAAIIFGTITVILRYKTYILLKEDRIKYQEDEGKGSN